MATGPGWKPELGPEDWVLKGTPQVPKPPTCLVNGGTTPCGAAVQAIPLGERCLLCQKLGKL